MSWFDSGPFPPGTPSAPRCPVMTTTGAVPDGAVPARSPPKEPQKARRWALQFLNADESPKRGVLTGRKAIAYKNATLNGVKLLFRHPGPVLTRRRHLVDDA